jgi:hypothetical protein
MGGFARAVSALLLCASLALAAPATAPRARLGDGDLTVKVSGPHGSSLTVDATLDKGQACDGTTATADGTAVLSGVVSGAFKLVSTSAAIKVHCGARGVGTPLFDVVVADNNNVLDVTASPGGESVHMTNFTIHAAIYDDNTTGEHSFAGSLQSVGGGGGGDSWWFDTCAGSFEVRSAFPPSRISHLCPA